MKKHRVSDLRKMRKHELIEAVKQEEQRLETLKRDVREVLDGKA